MRKTYVPPSGPRTAKIVVCGEQPGRTEVLKRTPFVGAAGKNLDECLKMANIPRSEVYFTNVIKDLDIPLEYYFSTKTIKGERIGEFSPEGEEYVKELEEELRVLRPNIIVACGNVALWALTKRLGITNWRGSVLSTLDGIKVIPTFHPATWTEEKLRLSESNFLNKYIVTMDLRKAKIESEFPEIRRISRNIRIAPTFYEAMGFLASCEKVLDDGGTIDYDIELVPMTHELSCIGFAISPEIAMCIPFVGEGGDYFTIEQETTIMVEIASLLERDGVFRGQNIGFDSHLLFRKFGIITRRKHDTMVAQKILYGDFAGSVDPTTGKPKGNSHRGGSLQFITSMWTDIPYYKQDGKQFLTGITNWDRAWEYNCLDTLSTSIAHPLQIKELKARDNVAAYERQIALIEPLTYMMEHGIKIDIQGMLNAREANRVRLDKLQRELKALMGNINFNSPKQLIQFFYEKLKIPPYTKDGTPTVDENALKRLKSQHNRPEAELLLQYRKLFKQNSTFLDPTKVDSDGRIRCSYNPVGTKYSRISSSENIFGTGMNLQNLPHEVLTYFVADEGYVIYEVDYSQYENRIVAYVGNIPQMIQAFEQNIDLHKLTAALVLTMMGNAKSVEEISGEDRQDYGKRPNHAFNYGLGPNLFALLHELPLSTSKAIHLAYHSAYPNLEKGYWRSIKDALSSTRTLTNLMGRKYTFLGKWGESLFKEAYSYIPQSTCGDCINERGVIFTYYNSSFESVELMTQIHDSMAFQIPLKVGFEEHARILIEIKKSLETPLDFAGREIKTPVDLVVNNCLNKDIGVEVKNNIFSENVDVLAKILQSGWERLNANKNSQEL